jgi:hypothetical protein
MTRLVLLLIVLSPLLGCSAGFHISDSARPQVIYATYHTVCNKNGHYCRRVPSQYHHPYNYHHT